MRRVYAGAMQLDAFIATHAPALESNEVRHNLILGVLARAAQGAIPQLSMWPLGAPGACAIRTPGRHIILGELQRDECHAFAEAMRNLAYPGVVGPGSMAPWFAERAAELGAVFADPIPERIYALHSAPNPSRLPWIRPPREGLGRHPSCRLADRILGRGCP